MLTAVEVPDDVAAVQRAVAGGATLLAGGTYLMPHLNDASFPPTRLVSLRRAGLDRVEVADGSVSLGAAVTLGAVEADLRLGFLNGCVRSIASPPVRSLATVGGNLFVTQPYGDLAVALLALDAEADVLGPAGSRRESVQTLVADGLQPGEFVAGIRFPEPAAGDFRFHKASRRRWNSASIVTIAARVRLDDGVVRDIRIALGGVAPTALRCEVAEDVLTGGPLDADTVLAAAQAALEVISPADDAYASAWYRRRVLPVHLRRSLLGS